MIQTVQDLFDRFMHDIRYENTADIDIVMWNEFINSVALKYYLSAIREHPVDPSVQTRFAKFRIITNGMMKYYVDTTGETVDYRHYYPLAPVFTQYMTNVNQYHPFYYLPGKTNEKTSQNRVKYLDFRNGNIAYSLEYPNIALLNNIYVLKFGDIPSNISEYDDDGDGLAPPPNFIVENPFDILEKHLLILNDNYDTSLIQNRYYKKPNVASFANRYYGNTYDGSHILKSTVNNNDITSTEYSHLVKVSFDPYVSVGQENYLYCLELDYYRYPVQMNYDDSAQPNHVQPEFASEDLEIICNMAVVSYLERINDERFNKYLQTNKNQ